MIDCANERSTPVTRITFKDDNGDPVVPAAAFYRIDDVGSGTEVRGETEIIIPSPATAEADIRWSQADTTILDESNAYETRLMTVWWTYGNDSPPNQGSSQYYLNIKNLFGMTAPSPA